MKYYKLGQGYYCFDNGNDVSSDFIEITQEEYLKHEENKCKCGNNTFRVVHENWDTYFFFCTKCGEKD